MDLKGSQTERNLVTAFVGESVARNRYTFFASQAKNDGYIQIAQVFEETANQEKEHAKRFFKFLQGGEVRIECGFPAGVVGPALENLSAAAEGENEEWSALYPSFAAKAREEGFKTIGVIFDMVSVAERHHEGRFRGLLESLRSGRVFKARSAGEMGVPELRLRSRRPGSPSRLPGPRPSAGLFRAVGRGVVSIGQQADGDEAEEDDARRLRHGVDAGSSTLTEIGEHDGQVVDVQRAISGELALGPRRAGPTEIGQHDGQVVEVDPPVTVRIAGYRDQHVLLIAGIESYRDVSSGGRTRLGSGTTTWLRSPFGRAGKRRRNGGKRAQ